MPNNYLSVLYKHIIQVENKNVGLKVWGGGGHKHTIAPPIKKVGGHMPPCPPPPRFLRQCVVLAFAHIYIYIYIGPIYIYMYIVHKVHDFSRKEELANTGTCARDRRALQQLACAC